MHSGWRGRREIPTRERRGTNPLKKPLGDRVGHRPRTQSEHCSIKARVLWGSPKMAVGRDVEVMREEMRRRNEDRE